MSKEVATFFSGNVPSADAMQDALRVASQDAKQGMAGDLPFLRLLTEGIWVFGQSNVDVEDDDVWALNPSSIETGYIAWKDSKPVGEHMAALGQPRININDLDQDLGKHTKGNRKGQKVEWSKQISCQLQCISGANEGTTVLYKTNSHGGMKALTSLVDKIGNQISKDEDFVPIIQLNVDSYDHTDYGKTYTPELDILEWSDGINLPDGAGVETEAEEESKPAPKKKAPARRRRRT